MRRHDRKLLAVILGVACTFNVLAENKKAYAYLNIVPLNQQRIPISGFPDVYLETLVVNQKTGKEVSSITRFHTSKGFRLPPGDYLVDIRQKAVGGTQERRQLHLSAGMTTVLKIPVKEFTTLNVEASWKGQPFHPWACIKYYNPFSSKRLGALMGGSSPSRGQCYDDKVVLRYEIKSANGNKLLYPDSLVIPKVVAGEYFLNLWPDGSPELKKQAHIQISPQMNALHYQFPWPYEEVTKTRNGKKFTYLVKKTDQ